MNVPSDLHHMVPYLFNRGCHKENSVRLHPDPSKGAFLFSKVSLWPQQWCADGHAAAKHSVCPTFLEASLRPHEGKEGIPYHSVKKKREDLKAMWWRRSKTETHTRTQQHLTYTQSLSGQMTSGVSRKNWDGNHYRNSCLPGNCHHCSACVTVGR